MIPTVIDFEGMAPSASIERALRHVLHRVEPLAGWVVGAQVRVCAAPNGGRMVQLALRLPGFTTVATQRLDSLAPADVGVAAHRALRHALLDVHARSIDSDASLAAAA